MSWMFVVFRSLAWVSILFIASLAETASFAQDGSSLSPPRKLKIKPKGITWRQTKGAKGYIYRFEKRLIGDREWTIIEKKGRTTLTKYPFHEEDFEQGWEYRFRVKAVSGKRKSRTSAIKFTTSDISSSLEGTRDNHGIGFGIQSIGISGGILYYDFNRLGSKVFDMDQKMDQIRVQFYTGSETRVNLLGTEAKVTQTRYSVTYRHVFRSGWYFGYGLGSLTSTYELNSRTLDENLSLVEAKVGFKGSGVFLPIEAGWQGDDFFYFHIAALVAPFVSYSDDYDIEKVAAESNYRSTTEEMWSEAKTTQGLMLGFGWYLVP